ncbi:FecR family protein [Hephaestia mangrovi]|uniref:FecR family protein n=1 Tax=Hephaestia mangrovi TaxID=2873268 RepID=UPI001CA5FD81|nr:FecR domain-containing protein [Hephaestia mangrovi]MBY8829650.1 FecR domain-containing protein [Hephaestia mangrovi]
MIDEGIPLGDRPDRAFERMFDERDAAIDARERDEAEAFWSWLGTFDRPPDPVPRASRWRSIALHGIALAAAASVAGVTLLAAGLHVPLFGEHGTPTLAYASGDGERRVIDMNDGSVITLAAQSRVEVAYTPGRRLVRLDRGEALFKVAHNKQRPFIVQAAGGEVKAVGTAFDVKLDGESSAKVTVVEGVIRIAVASASKDNQEQIARIARKGDQVSFGVKPEQSARVAYIGASQKADADLATSWTRGMLYFHGEPLSQVVKTVNSYAKDKIAPPPASKANVPVFGIIAEGDTAAVRELVASAN